MIELNISTTRKDILDHLKNVKTDLVGISNAYEKVEESGRRAFGLAGKTTRQYNDEIKRTNGLIEDIEENIKDWEEKSRKATNIADLQKYNRKIAEAKQHLKEYQKSGVEALENVNKKVKTTTGLFSNLNNTIKTAFTAAVFNRVLGDLVDTSLSLDTLDKKATTVFGRYAQEVKQVGQSTAASLGMTEAEFLRAASGAGDVMKQLQLSSKEAAVMSTGLVTLSGSLAEWSAGQYDSVETSKILTKAFLGEYESLKSLDIAIRDSDVSAKLAEKGQKDLTGSKLAQAKALATLELLYERTSDRQEAFKNNSGSLTRQYSEMNAKFKTVKDTISADLIPTFNQFFGFVNRNFETIKTLAKWVGLLTASILGYKAGVVVTNGVMKLYTTVTNMATIATKTFDKATKTTLVGALAGLLTAAAAAFLIFRDDADEATDSQKEFNKAVEEGNTLLEDVKSLEERSKVIDKMTKYQLEKFKSDAEMQLQQISEFDEKKLLARKKYLDEVDKLEELKNNNSRYIDQITQRDAVNQAAKHYQEMEKITMDANAGELQLYIDQANEKLKLFKSTDDKIGVYEKLKNEVKKLEDQLKDEIAANNSNYLSTAKLLWVKKQELQVIEDINNALLQNVGIKKMQTRKMDFQSLYNQEKVNLFFDTDYEYAENIDEDKLKEDLLNGMFKVLAARKAAASEMGKNLSVDNSDEDFSFWSLVGLDPDNPNDQEMIAALQEQTNQMISMIRQVADAEAQAAAERLALKNTLIAEKQREIEAEIELNKQGYASNIQLKQDELEALKRERQKALDDQEKAKRKQLVIDSIMQASSLLTSSVKLIESATKSMGIWGLAVAVPLIAAMFGMFISSKSKAAKLTKLRYGRTGIIAGKSHEEGGENFEVEGGEYHSITPKSKAKKHLPLLEAIRKDDKIGMAKALYNLIDDFELSRGLPRRLQDKQEQLKLNQTVRIDDRSLSETNRLLGVMVGKNNSPSIDTSDPNYTKYIFGEHYEKWVRK